MEIKLDENNRIVLLTEERDETGSWTHCERVVPIEYAIKIKNQLSLAIDIALQNENT